MNRDRICLLHILESIDKIQSYASVGKAEFLATSHWQDAIIRNLEIIGETSKRLSPAFKENSSDIPWRRVAGLRDILIHDYFGVDMEAVWQVVEQHLPELKRIVVAGLQEKSS